MGRELTLEKQFQIAHRSVKDSFDMGQPVAAMQNAGTLRVVLDKIIKAEEKAAKEAATEQPK